MSDDVDIQNTGEASASSEPAFATLCAPRPLTSDEYRQIIISEYIDILSDDEFAAEFDCAKTPENIDALIQGQKKLSKSVTKHIQHSIAATFKAMQNFALEGKAAASWLLTERLAHFSEQDMHYIAYKEGDTRDLRPYIRIRFSNIPDVAWTLDFIENVETANTISSGNSQNINMKNAEKIYNNLRKYEPNLDAEQKSAIYFLSSELFRRAQIVPGIYNEPKPCSKEVYCLQMVLENTSMPSLIDCCLDRMSADKQLLKENIPLFISAYKKVLAGKKTLFSEDSYRINSQIAQLYQQSTGRSKAGFTGIDPQTAANLYWAEYFYRQAYKKAPTDKHKVTALNAMAKIQNSLGKRDKAVSSSVQAAKLMPVPERYEKLIETAAADNNALKSLQLIRQTVTQIKKDKIPADMKKILFDKTRNIVRQKYRDEKVISSVERLMTNTVLTPNKKIVRKSSTRE